MMAWPETNPNQQLPTLDETELHLWRLPYRPSQGRAPLVRLLAAYLHLTEDGPVLESGPHGRPRLASHHGDTLDFNWSHSGDHAVVAIGRGISPGVDIERQRHRASALAIAERYFEPAESQWLASLDEQARQRGFLQLWTAKEAVLKAQGRGIAFGLHRLHIDPRGAAPRLLRLDGEDVAQWQLMRLEPFPGLLGALAWRGGARCLRGFSLVAPLT